MMYRKKLDIVLIVEDNEDHLEHTRDALEESEIAHTIKFVRDGESALDYLFRRKAFADPHDSPRPGLILLDLSLPKINGYEILEQLKSDSELRKIPVIVLTSAARCEDIQRGAILGTNDYILKPMEFESFRSKIQALGIYWARISDLS